MEISCKENYERSSYGKHLSLAACFRATARSVMSDKN